MKTNVFTALKVLAGVAGILYLLQLLVFVQMVLREFGRVPLDMWPALLIAAVRIAACAGVFFVNAGRTLAQKILTGILLFVFAADLLLQLFIVFAFGPGDVLAAAVNFISAGLLAALWSVLCYIAWQKRRGAA